MIVPEVTLDISKALHGFERLAGRFSDFTPVMGGRLDVAARALIRRQFETQGRAGAGGGGGWKHLTARYAKQKARDEFGRDRMNRIMQRTDSLFRTLTVKGEPGQFFRATRTSYRLGVDPNAIDPTGRDLYPRFIAAQLGIAPQPERQVIPDPLPKGFIRDVQRILATYIVGDLN